MGITSQCKVLHTELTCTSAMSSASSSQPQSSASGSKSKKVASSKKPKAMATASNPSYRTMITKALHATKERKGLSRPAIMKYMVGASIVPNTGLLNKMLKKMSDEGKVVPGADVGKRGSGCFKLSTEEKMMLLQIEKAALKKEKLKAKGSDVKKVSKKKVSVTKKSVKGGKVIVAVKSKPKSTSSKSMPSKVSGIAKKKTLGAKPKKNVKSQGVVKVKKVAKQAKKYLPLTNYY